MRTPKTSKTAAATPNLRHLQLFLRVIEQRNISAVARAGHLTQPAVTQAIARVEAALGGRLFERAPNSVQPTDLGMLAAGRVGRALQILREALEAVRKRSVKSDMSVPDALRGISVSQLTALVGVAQYGGIAGAARAIGQTRAAVHRAVRHLERLLEVALLENTSFGIRATREADRLARHTQLAWAEIQQARAEIATAAGRGSGRTVIGVMPLARSVLVPGAVLELAQLRPEHQICILDGPYENMLAALRCGAADVLIGALRDPVPAPDVEQERLFEDPLAIVFRAGHPLERRSALTVAALASFPWIAPRAESPLRRQFDALLAELGGAARAAPIECNSLVAARAILLASDRLMLLSAHQIQHELRTAQLVARPHPFGPVMRRIGLTMRRAWQPTEVQRQFVDILRRHAQARGSF